MREPLDGDRFDAGIAEDDLVEAGRGRVAIERGLNIAGGNEVLSGANTYTGATAVAIGANLELSGSGSIAASSGLVNNGTFDIAATNNGAEVQSLSGSGAVLLGGQTLTLTNAHDSFAGVIQGNGGLNVAGGNEVLSGVNTYTGATNVAQWSTLELSGSGSIAASSGLVNNGSFDIAATNNGAEVQSLSGSGAVLLGGQTLTLTNAGGDFAGVIQGNGGLNVAGGSEILSGTNAYTGATTINAGTLTLGNAFALQDSTLAVPTSTVRSLSFSTPAARALR